MKPQHILVVDDEESILFAVREYFTTFGYAVDVAQDLAEAKALLDAGSYAVVIADLRLTGIFDDTQGLDVVRYVRERSPSTRIMLLTAYGSPEIEAEARRRGADAFLHKPMPLPAVAQIIFGLTGVS